MEVGCELQVDVNGEEIFMVDKKILTCFSRRFRRLFGKLTCSSTRHLKVIFQDFPGGADGFELVTRFCYNSGAIEITPSNIILLNCAAYFMEMGRNNGSGAPNLVDQTEKSLEGINYWTWSDLLVAMKQCQDLFPEANSSFVFQKVLESFVGRLALPTLESPLTYSSDNFSCQFSSDRSSTCSTRNNWSPTTWWFEDLLFLNVDLFDKAIRLMVSQKLDHATILKFLIFYLKSKLVTVSLSEKCQIVEVVISLLSLLDRTCLSCKGLFDILRIVLSLKRISKCYKLKLERLIGSKLDEATLDHLLVRSPHGKDYMYDVKLVLKLVEGYLLEGWMIPSRLKKVASLMDLFLIEVAPDYRLKPSKFSALLLVLPDSARESNDELYQAIDLYLEVHTQLCEEEKIILYGAINHDKLSKEALKHMAQNSKFPSRAQVQALIAQHSNHHSFFFLKRVTHGLPVCSINEEKITKEEDTEQVQVLPSARKHEHPIESGNIETHLQQMQWRVKELEKFCTVMETQMPNVTKRSSCYRGKVRSLPKLCSC